MVVSKYRPSILKDYLVDNTDLDDKECDLISKNITKQVYDKFDEIVSTDILKSLVLNNLIKRGKVDEVDNNVVLGLTVNEFEELNKNGCKDNANLSYSPSQVEKYTYDAVAKKYALEIMPRRSKEFYLKNYIHHHDLESYANKPNCFNIDLRFIARNGLVLDGSGDNCCVAKPAKSFKVLLNHMLQLLMGLSQVFSGGLGYVNFNTLLAPFVRGMDYKDIYQELEGFIFNCNMSLVSKGGQTIFSSIGMDLSCPKPLEDEDVVLRGGVTDGTTYKDYEAEANLIFKIICEIISKGDGKGKYFRYPNICFNIRKGDLDNYEGNCKLLHELGANNPTIYYVNCVDEEKAIMGCRTANVCNYTGDYYNDCVNTGNFMYSTINLPLLDLETDNVKEFYDLLEECCEVVYETLVHRRQTIIDIHNNGIAPILDWRDNETGEKFYDINNTSLSIGYCGLSELLKQNDDLNGIEVIEFINKKKDEFCERDGLRWVVIGSPAESTAWKFGKYNKSKYPNSAIVNGSEGNYYLTNSHHINVAEGTIGEHIDNASVYHRLSKGGCILHIWLNEAFSSAEAFWSLNKKIISEGVQFWDYTKTFSYCNICGFKINDDIDECPVCGGHDISKSTRITGFYLDIRTFNDGKLEENNDRNYQKL